ncbi:TPA: hypothetical protein L4V39_002871 [Pseudomonas aeruginosa]|nr:hypothetical protein [Pseudomonas aeruginosa]
MGNNNVSLGYTGQRLSAVHGGYLLGNGYRSFNPVIRRFCSWDSASPFDNGGVHGYSYCQGDPINQSDPSGHGPLVWAMVGAISFRNGLLAAEAAEAASASEVSKILNGALKYPGLEDNSPITSELLPDFERIDHTNESARASSRDAWHCVSDEATGQQIWGADVAITGDDISTPLKEIEALDDNKDIIVLSGSHGTFNGNNWRKGTGKRMEELLERGFYYEDFDGVFDFIENFGGETEIRWFRGLEGSLGGRVHVIDMEGMSVTRFEQIINDKNNHVILGYCFGRNDRLLRAIKKLPPVTSYIRAYDYSKMVGKPKSEVMKLFHG